MDAGQHDARMAELERRLAEVEHDNQRLRTDNRRLKAEVRRLTERLAQYEPEIRHEATRLDSDLARPSDYSLEGESKRRQRRQRHRKKKSPGRRPTELKFNDAHRYDNVYPEGVRPDACTLVRQRAVWRLEDGRGVLVGYRIFAGPDAKEPRIPGVTPRCEYGIEILVVLAFLVYIIGISLDKACRVLAFFCQLPLSRSQADALLRQLAQHWEGEFDLLCGLIAHAAVVDMDETGWKVGREGCSLWAFASRLQRVFLFGCHKDDATLDQMLPPDVFAGIGVSDDAAVYQGRFARRRSAGRICCARRSSWRCCTRASKGISGFWTDFCSCTTTPSEPPRMVGWAKRAGSNGWPSWKAGSVSCASRTIARPRRTCNRTSATLPTWSRS